MMALPPTHITLMQHLGFYAGVCALLLPTSSVFQNEGGEARFIPGVNLLIRETFVVPKLIPENIFYLKEL